MPGAMFNIPCLARLSSSLKNADIQFITMLIDLQLIEEKNTE